MREKKQSKLVRSIQLYREGVLTDEEAVILFQKLINKGWIYYLEYDLKKQALNLHLAGFVTGLKPFYPR